MNKYFTYDTTSPSCITRLEGRYAGHCGYLDKDGYYLVNKVKKTYRAHRVVWMLFHGEIPKGLEIDHINHIRSDNRIENLRLVTKSQNQRNRIAKGYYYNKERNMWQAQGVTIEGKKVCIGRFNTEQEAIKAVTIFKEKHYVNY